MQDLEKFESVGQWEKSLRANSRTGQLSESNWRVCLSILGTYLKFIKVGVTGGLTPDQLIEEGLRDEDIARARLMSWYNWLIGNDVKGYDEWKRSGEPHSVSQNTAVTYLGRVRGFYTHNKVVFGKWKMPSRKTTQTEKADARVDVYKFDEENGELYVDTQLLQQFLGNLSFRDQTIALALYSTSQDPSDIFKLTIGWLRAQEGERRLFWMGNRKKTGEPFKVFFSAEATDFVRRYVEQEREGAADSEAIWVKSKNYSYEHKGKEVKIGGCMDTTSLNDNFRKAAEKIHMTEKGKPNPFRPKRFRHLFRNACTSAGIDPGIAQAFMGHKTDISGRYLSRGKGWLLSRYVKVEPFLIVFKSNEQQQFNKFREELNTAKADLESARRERDQLTRTTHRLEKEVKGLKDELEKDRELLKLLMNAAEEYPERIERLMKSIMSETSSDS